MGHLHVATKIYHSVQQVLVFRSLHVQFLEACMYTFFHPHICLLHNIVAECPGQSIFGTLLLRSG